MQNWKKLTWALLLFRMTILMGQSLPVQHCYFSKLTFSADSSRLFFQSFYCEEGEPLVPEPAWLSLDLKTHSLQYLNPRPTRFVLSTDNSLLLFSSRYGLFLMNVEEPHHLRQLVFWNPAQGMYVNQLGFLADSSGIGWTSISATGSLRAHAFSWPKAKKYIPLADTMAISDTLTLHSKTVQGPETVSRWKHFSAANPIFPLRLQQMPSANSYQKRLEITLPERSAPNILLSKLRPRLLSLNPDSSLLFISILDSSYQARSFVFDIQTGKDMGQFDMGFDFMCWLTENQFIGQNKIGLFRVTIQPPEFKKIIPLDDSAIDSVREGQNNLFQIITSTDDYQRSHIVMETTDSIMVLVPEWSWFPSSSPMLPQP